MANGRFKCNRKYIKVYILDNIDGILAEILHFFEKLYVRSLEKLLGLMVLPLLCSKSVGM